MQGVQTGVVYLGLGLPDPNQGTPAADLITSVAEVGRIPPSELAEAFSYGDERGDPLLLNWISKQLSLDCGNFVDPTQNIMITYGVFLPSK